jgi:hypothetical protein
MGASILDSFSFFVEKNLRFEDTATGFPPLRQFQARRRPHGGPPVYYPVSEAHRSALKIVE